MILPGIRQGSISRDGAVLVPLPALLLCTPAERAGSSHSKHRTGQQGSGFGGKTGGDWSVQPSRTKAEVRCNSCLQTSEAQKIQEFLG